MLIAAVLVLIEDGDPIPSDVEAELIERYGVDVAALRETTQGR
jgi:hypothetical protein